MQIEDGPSAKSLSSLYREREQLDHLKHVAELDESQPSIRSTQGVNET